jgi:acetyl-CoA synthetase
MFVIRKPFPGLTPTLWGDPERYRRDYWEAKPGTRGLYLAGDAAYKDKDGYIWFAGRADEIIKIAAHRIGTIEVENALISHPAVIEGAVSGVPDELRGEVASACVVLAQGYQPGEELKKELSQHIRKEIGPIVVIKDIVFVNMLPKTRSGKIMRRVIKSLLTDRDLGDISTIEEEASIDEVREALSKMEKQ